MIWPIFRLILVAFRFVPNRYKLRFLLFAVPFLVERFRRSGPRRGSGSRGRGCGCCLPILAATGSALIFVARRFVRGRA
jgi:hypothetical protein